MILLNVRKVKDKWLLLAFGLACLTVSFRSSNTLPSHSVDYVNVPVLTDSGPCEVGVFPSEKLVSNLPDLLGKDYSFTIQTLGKPLSVHKIPGRDEIRLEYKMMIMRSQGQGSISRRDYVPVHVRLVRNSLTSICLDYSKPSKKVIDYPYRNLPVPLIQAIGIVQSVPFCLTHRSEGPKPNNAARDSMWRRISVNLRKLQDLDEHEIERLLGPAEYSFGVRGNDGFYHFEMFYYPFQIWSDSNTLTAEMLRIRFAHNRPQTIELSKFAGGVIF